MNQPRDLNTYRRYRRLLEAATRGGWNVRPGSEQGTAETMTYLYAYDLATGKLIAGGTPAEAFAAQLVGNSELAQDELVGMVTGLLVDAFDMPYRVSELLHGADPHEAVLQGAALYFGITQASHRLEKPPADYHVFVLLYRRERSKEASLRPFAVRAPHDQGLLEPAHVYRVISDVVAQDRRQNPRLFHSRHRADVIPFPRLWPE